MQDETANASVLMGQVWRQSQYPYNVRYVVMIPDGYILVHDPMQDGAFAYVDDTGKWQYTQAELEEHFRRYGYTCQGQLSERLRKPSIRDLADEHGVDLSKVCDQQHHIDVPTQKGNAE